MKKYQVLLVAHNPMYPDDDMDLEFFFEDEKTATQFIRFAGNIELETIYRSECGDFIDSIYYKAKDLSCVEVSEEVDTTLWIQFLKTLGIKVEIISGGDLCRV